MTLTDVEATQEHVVFQQAESDVTFVADAGHVEVTGYDVDSILCENCGKQLDGDQLIAVDDDTDPREK